MKLFFTALFILKSKVSWKKKDYYSESQVASRYYASNWLNWVLAKVGNSECIETQTDIVFRKNIPLGCNVDRVIFRLGSPYRLFRHPEVNLQVLHYKKKHLGNYVLNFELLIYNGKFCAAIYFLNPMASLSDIKKGLILKYINSIGNSDLNDFENLVLNDCNNNQLLFLTSEFVTLLVYSIKDSLVELADEIADKNNRKKEHLEKENILRIINEL